MVGLYIVVEFVQHFFPSTELSSEVVTIDTLQAYVWNGDIAPCILKLFLPRAAFAVEKELQVTIEQEAKWPPCWSRQFGKERKLSGKFLAPGSNLNAILMVSSL